MLLSWGSFIVALDTCREVFNWEHGNASWRKRCMDAGERFGVPAEPLPLLTYPLPIMDAVHGAAAEEVVVVVGVAAALDRAVAQVASVRFGGCFHELARTAAAEAVVEAAAAVPAADVGAVAITAAVVAVPAAMLPDHGARPVAVRAVVTPHTVRAVAAVVVT